MANFLALPILGLALMVQLGIVSRISVLSGNADLFLVILISWAIHDRRKTAWLWAVIAGILVGYVSELPWYVYMIGYLCVVGLTFLIQRRIWQTLLLEVFVVIFLGTLILHALTMGYLLIMGSTFNLVDTLGIVTLPSILLNLIIVIPVYLLIRDFANWIQPIREDIE